ncbi:hypothetical protein SESBI_01266 [Sesbania bispinosa]|nr:hypothetical protein SESBI_01266 [Sesbania bispinosa]
MEKNSPLLRRRSGLWQTAAGSTTHNDDKLKKQTVARLATESGDGEATYGLAATNSDDGEATYDMGLQQTMALGAIHAIEVLLLRRGCSSNRL